MTKSKKVKSKTVKAEWNIWIKERFGHWLKTLALCPCTINYLFETEPCEDRDGAIFEIDSEFPYRSAKLTIYPVARGLDRTQLDLMLLHEAIHLVLEPMVAGRLLAHQIYEREIEGVTEQLAHCIFAIGGNRGA